MNNIRIEMLNNKKSFFLLMLTYAKIYSIIQLFLFSLSILKQLKKNSLPGKI